MRVAAFFAVLLRLGAVAFCGFAVWLSIHTAKVDWIASAGTAAGYRRALQLEPNDAELLARAAVFRSDNDDTSPETDRDLRRALQANPYNSAVLMTLGLREEFQGNAAAAKNDFVRAAQADHQFKPAWTLANYFYRSSEPAQAWPMIERILHLDPLGFDLTPVFDLCWKLSAQGGAADEAAGTRILNLIPGGLKSIQYFWFLTQTKRTEAALAAWPKALAAANSVDRAQTEPLSEFPDFLDGAGHIQEAVAVWNQLIDNGLIQSGRLNPAKGAFLADPDFKFGPTTRVFGWRVADVPGVLTTGFSGAVNFEISGDEPQSFQILSTTAPLVAGGKYRLQWKTESSALSAPRDPGFAFHLVLGATEPPIACPPLLASPSAGCDFVVPFNTGPANTGQARIDLVYAREPGTVRASGTLQLLSVRLETRQ